MARIQDPHDAHKLLTALMIERADLSARGESLSTYEIEGDLLQEATRLPLIGCHVDPKGGEVVVNLHEIAHLDAGRHRAILKPLLGEVPYSIRYGINENQSAPAKDQNARPLWGGVQMSTSTDLGTLTLVVEKSSKDKTLLSSHVVGYRQTGVEVGQASVPTGGTYGAVTDNPNVFERKSDSALASIDKNKITGEENRIWKAKDTAFEVVGFAQDSDFKMGLAICMQGAFTTDLSHGAVADTGVTSVRPGNMVLTDQVTADYESTGGDSGGPVFFMKKDSETQVIFAGIHVGTHSGKKLFSPWSGIKADLGL